MKERTERTIRFDFHRNPERLVDEIERTAASMKQKGWDFLESVTETGFNNIILKFERKIEE